MSGAVCDAAVPRAAGQARVLERRAFDDEFGYGIVAPPPVHPIDTSGGEVRSVRDVAVCGAAADAKVIRDFLHTVRREVPKPTLVSFGCFGRENADGEENAMGRFGGQPRSAVLRFDDVPIFQSHAGRRFPDRSRRSAVVDPYSEIGSKVRRTRAAQGNGAVVRACIEVVVEYVDADGLSLRSLCNGDREASQDCGSQCPARRASGSRDAIGTDH